jgi:hypothetical protein
MPVASSLAAVLDWHRRRYPLLQARDIYKLVHQGVFGPGHAVASAAQARDGLARELRALATECRIQIADCRLQNCADEELIEPIDPRGRLVRVNLRPFLGEVKGQKAKAKRQNRGRADAGWLAEALVESARRVKGNPAQMARRLSAAVRWCRKDLPRQAAGLERMAALAREAGYPAFHHSPAYQRAYRPAYRVSLKTCLDSMARLSRKGRPKREVRGEKLEPRAGFGTSDI